MPHRFPALGQRRTQVADDNNLQPGHHQTALGGSSLAAEHNRNAAHPEQNNGYRFGQFVCPVWMFGHG